VYPDPKHWLKIFEKKETFRENHPRNKNFLQKPYGEQKMLVKTKIFAYFRFSAKLKKGVFVSILGGEWQT
jgi:hypothetical protein